MSWAGPVGSDIESNDIVSRACRKYPSRFLGLVYINPVHVPREALLAELRRLVEEEGFVGLKPYHLAGLDYNDPLYDSCWEYADRRGLYALLHLGAGAVGRVAGDLAARYPHVQWLIAHTGGSFAMARAVAAAMKKHPNVWAELTLTPVTNGLIEWLVAEVGDERVCFGTDAPMRDPRPQFGWVVWADLPVESRRRILGANFARLLACRRVV
jgi:predicted TIM-barrel fold metal-dependent hydrolase